MTLRHFKIFVAVCDVMNMTAAAKMLFISQSAVSQAISEMERHYNIKLFERLSKKLYLTSAGRRLLSYARHIINMSLMAENDMKLLCKNDSIRVGVSVTVGGYVLPKLVSKFNYIYPETSIGVFEDNTAKIEALILKDKIDIGLVEGETTSEDVLKYPFMDDQLVLICGPNHPFTHLPVVEAKELEKEKFIIREKGSGTRKTFEDAMKSCNLFWKTIWTCNNTDTIKMAVSEGIGVSVISKLAIVNEVESGLICRIDVKDIQFNRKFKIIYHKNKYLTESMRHFIDICKCMN